MGMLHRMTIRMDAVIAVAIAVVMDMTQMTIPTCRSIRRRGLW